MKRMKGTWQRLPLWIGTMTLLLSACGCGQKPPAPIIVGRGDAQLEAAILSAAEPAEPGEAAQAPLRVRETYRMGTDHVTVELDADVPFPAGPVPSARVSPHRFTQGDAARMIQYLADGGTLYVEPEESPCAERVAAQLAQYRRFNEMAAAQPELFSPNARVVSSGGLARALEQYQAQSKTAEPLVEYAAESIAFTPVSGVGDVAERLQGSLLIDGACYSFSMTNDAAGKLGVMSCVRAGDDPLALKLLAPHQLRFRDEGVDIPGCAYQTALQAAGEIAAGIGAEDMALGRGYGVEYPGRMCDGYYAFLFVRQIDGVAVGAAQGGVADEVYNQGVSDAGYETAWPNERREIHIDAQGALKSVHWSAPMDVIERVVSDTALLPFSEILSCFSKLVFVQNAYADELGWENDRGETVDGVRVDVNRIAFSLMRVQSGSAYYLIPVWDFYGHMERLDAAGSPFSFSATRPGSEYTEYGRKGESIRWSALIKTDEEYAYNRMIEGQASIITINAVDGTVIDRRHGY